MCSCRSEKVRMFKGVLGHYIAGEAWDSLTRTPDAGEKPVSRFPDMEDMLILPSPPAVLFHLLPAVNL